MAITKIWKVKARLDHVLDYAANEEKTSLDNYYVDLDNVYHYAMNSDKTEKQYFVTGINCSPEIANKEMKITKESYGKTDKILAFHVVQSFAIGEIKPKVAHEIGIKFAEEIWGDRFEVLVTTHLNTDSIHNHIVINSVSFADGLKYYDNLTNYAYMREISDSLCREYGLSVIPEKPCPKSKIYYPNFVKSKYQNSNYFQTTKEDIDKAIRQAYSYKDFERILEKMGYSLTYRANKLSVCREEYKRNIRVERAYGENYTINHLKERILEETETRVPFHEALARKRFTCKNRLSRLKSVDKKYRTSYYRLYLYYRYKLNSYRNFQTRKPLTDEQREAIKQMDKFSNEAKFLSRNKIHFSEELFSYKGVLEQELTKLESQIANINKELRKSQYTDERLKAEKLEIKNRLNYVREELELCNDIKKRIPKIKEELNEKDEKEIQEKEREKDEHSR